MVYHSSTRGGKAYVSRRAAAIFERLGTSGEYWQDRLRNLFGKSRMLGSYFAVDLSRLRDVTAHRGIHHGDDTVAVA